MTYAPVQSNTATGTTANAAPTLLAGATAGNLITIQFRFNLAISGVTIPALFGSDALKDFAGAAPMCGIISKVATGGETTFTFTNIAGGTWHMEVNEWSGNATSSPLDAASAGANGTAVTSLAPGSLTPGATGELMLAVATQSASNGGETATGSGWTDQDQATFNLANFARKIKTDALAENPTLGWTTARNAVAIQAAYKLLAAAGAVLDERQSPRGNLRGAMRGTT